MNHKSEDVATVADLNNGGDAHPTVIEATSDEAESAAIAIRSPTTNDATELVVASSSANDLVEKKSRREGKGRSFTRSLLSPVSFKSSRNPGAT